MNVIYYIKHVHVPKASIIYNYAGKIIHTIISLTCNDDAGLGCRELLTAANIAWSMELIDSLRVSMALSHSFCPGHFSLMANISERTESVIACGRRKGIANTSQK